MTRKNLDKICEFADRCAESDYGSNKICEEDYKQCDLYQKYIQNEINNRKNWAWWWR